MLAAGHVSSRCPTVSAHVCVPRVYCRDELHALLREERLFGATLLVFANKQDIPSALSVAELEKVRAQQRGV